MAVKLRCPVCREKFVWDVSNGWPRDCLICKVDIGQVGQDDDNVIAMPAFLTAHSKVPDKVARDYMDGSEKRIEIATQMAGGTSEDYASLKVTDLTDAPHPMLSPAMPVNNPVTQFMAQNPQAPVGMRADGAQYSTQIQMPTIGKNGRPNPDANAGAKTLTDMNNFWAKGGTPLVDRPALETQQPGYRRRG
jgi:hypothetical protein